MLRSATTSTGEARLRCLSAALQVTVKPAGSGENEELIFFFQVDGSGQVFKTACLASIASYRASPRHQKHDVVLVVGLVVGPHYPGSK